MWNEARAAGVDDGVDEQGKAEGYTNGHVIESIGVVIIQLEILRTTIDFFFEWNFWGRRISTGSRVCHNKLKFIFN